MLSEREKTAAQANKTSRKRAIELHCKDCLYDPSAAGTWREQALLEIALCGTSGLGRPRGRNDYGHW